MMNLTSNRFNSEFVLELRKVFKEYYPLKLIETGTYLGIGSTAIIAFLLKEMKLRESVFYSIEVNPDYHYQAVENLKELKLLDYVRPLKGLSIKREYLPSAQSIEDMFVKKVWPPGVYIDHKEKERVRLYREETDFANVPDNLLLQCLWSFNFQPDFVLLDSGGHIGHLEFHTLKNLLKGSCIIALDDINHVKHYDSFKDIQIDPRFKILKTSEERFGFCITRFDPKWGGA